MRPLVEFPLDALRAVRHVLTDIDDTLTDRGRLGAKAYGALEALSAAGMTVVVVTGRPAGWCDMIARQWPVSAVVGENGACYMRYDAARGRMERRFWRDGAARAADRARLKALGRRILREVPGNGAGVRPALSRGRPRHRLLRGRAALGAGGGRAHFGPFPRRRAPRPRQARSMSMAGSAITTSWR